MFYLGIDRLYTMKKSKGSHQKSDESRSEYPKNEGAGGYVALLERVELGC